MRWLVGLLATLVLAGIVVTIVGGITGRFVAYDLYTHCGIRSADINGERLYADPPLNDGDGNPPSGWGNPSDFGFMFIEDADHAVFVDWSGHRANFSTHPRTGIPTIEVCS